MRIAWLLTLAATFALILATSRERATAQPAPATNAPSTATNSAVPETPSLAGPEVPKTNAVPEHPATGVTTPSPTSPATAPTVPASPNPAPPTSASPTPPTAPVAPTNPPKAPAEPPPLTVTNLPVTPSATNPLPTPPLVPTPVATNSAASVPTNPPAPPRALPASNPPVVVAPSTNAVPSPTPPTNAVPMPPTNVVATPTTNAVALAPTNALAIPKNPLGTPTNAPSTPTNLLAIPTPPATNAFVPPLTIAATNAPSAPVVPMPSPPVTNEAPVPMETTAPSVPTESMPEPPPLMQSATNFPSFPSSRPVPLDEIDPNAIELRFWNIPIPNSSNPEAVANYRIFQAFLRDHPHIRPKVLVPLRIEGPAAEGNEFLAVAGGVAPDIFYLAGRKVGDYRSQGFLLPLNHYLKGYASRQKRPYLGVSAPSKVWELTYDRGNIYAVPAGYYSMALMCSKVEFARAGVAGRFPKNWDELYEIARAITYDPAKELSGKPDEQVVFGLSIAGLPGAGWQYLQYVWSAGGNVVQPYYDKDGKLLPVPPPEVDFSTLGVKVSDEASYTEELARDREKLEAEKLPINYTSDDVQWRLETNGPKAIKALEFYRRLTQQPWMRNKGREFDITPEMIRNQVAVDPHTQEQFDLNDPVIRRRLYFGVSDVAIADQTGSRFRKKAYGMQLGTVAESADQNTDILEWDFAPFPSIAGEPPAAFIAGTYLGINAAMVAEDTPGRRDIAAVRQAAWDYIEYLTGQQAQDIKIRTYIEFGVESFIRPALLQDSGYEDLMSRIPPEKMALWDNLNKHAHIEPYAKGFSHVASRDLGFAIEQIFNDRINMQTGTYLHDPQTVMDGIVANVNTTILGRLPAAEIERRGAIGWVVLALVVVAIGFGTRSIIHLLMKQSRQRAMEGFGAGANSRRRRILAWAFLLPAFLSIAIWAYIPLAQGSRIAFLDYKILGGSSYTGISNFVEVVSSSKFYIYWLQTFEYALLSVALGFFVPILLALLLHEIPRGKILFRTIYYLPAVTTGLVTLFLWKHLLFDPTSSGLLNSLILSFNTWPSWMATTLRLLLFVFQIIILLVAVKHMLDRHHTKGMRLAFASIVGLIVGLLLLTVGVAWQQGGLAGIEALFVGRFDFQAQRFLRDPQWAMFWLIVPGVWAGAGPGCLIYLAALKGIPDEQYEAADLDGANFVEKFLHVTIPNLSGLVVINFVGAVIGAFHASQNIMVMTGGGPEERTMTIGLDIFFKAFLYLDFGAATASAWIMGALLIGFTLHQLRILNRLQFKNAPTDE